MKKNKHFTYKNAYHYSNKLGLLWLFFCKSMCEYNSDGSVLWNRVFVTKYVSRNRVKNDKNIYEIPAFLSSQKEEILSWKIQSSNFPTLDILDCMVKERQFQNHFFCSYSCKFKTKHQKWHKFSHFQNPEPDFWNKTDPSLAYANCAECIF